MNSQLPVSTPSSGAAIESTVPSVVVRSGRLQTRPQAGEMRLMEEEVKSSLKSEINAGGLFPLCCGLQAERPASHRRRPLFKTITLEDRGRGGQRVGVCWLPRQVSLGGCLGRGSNHWVEYATRAQQQPQVFFLLLTSAGLKSSHPGGQAGREPLVAPSGQKQLRACRALRMIVPESFWRRFRMGLAFLWHKVTW